MTLALFEDQLLHFNMSMSDNLKSPSGIFFSIDLAKDDPASTS